MSFLKYDVLYAYRKYLETKYSKETARTYYIKLDNLLDDQRINEDTIELDFEKILKRLEEIKYKSYFSQYKSALLRFCEFADITVSDEYLEYIEYLKHGKKKKYRKLEAIDYTKIEKRIKHLRNKKLKLSYQAMVQTGLRVSELAQIKPRDCVIYEDKIIFHFISKGGKPEEVTLYKQDNQTIYRNIKEQIENTDEERCVFYSAIYLQTKATELGFKCHDLRRAFAKMEYKKSKSKEEVMKKLRHVHIKSTNIYLNRTIKI